MASAQLWLVEFRRRLPDDVFFNVVMEALARPGPSNPIIYEFHETRGQKRTYDDSIKSDVPPNRILPVDQVSEGREKRFVTDEGSEATSQFFARCDLTCGCSPNNISCLPQGSVTDEPVPKSKKVRLHSQSEATDYEKFVANCEIVFTSRYILQPGTDSIRQEPGIYSISYTQY